MVISLAARTGVRFNRASLCLLAGLALVSHTWRFTAANPRVQTPIEKSGVDLHFGYWHYELPTPIADVAHLLHDLVLEVPRQD